MSKKEGSKAQADVAIGSITIALIQKGGNPSRADIRYDLNNVSPFMAPTLLRKVAKDIEDAILKGTGVV